MLMRPERSEIERWAVDETIYSETAQTDLADIVVTADITHPIFADGGTGEPKLNISITRASKREFTLRLMCPRNNMAELIETARMLSDLVSRNEECLRKLKRYQDDWNDQRVQEHAQWQNEQAEKSRRDGMKGVGEGLSKYSSRRKERRYERNGD
jgi:hypothetical protein